MNTLVKVGVATALVVGGAATANAQFFTQPTSGSSDLLLFAEVVNNATGSAIAYYAGDTSVSVATAYGGSLASQTALAGDGNLSSLFAADGTGDSIQWGVVGGAWSGAISSANFDKTGKAVFATTAFDGTNTLSQMTTSSLQAWAGIAADISTTQSAAGTNKSLLVTGSSAGSGVWDVNNTVGLITWYGSGPLTANTSATTTGLYTLTGDGAGGGASDAALFKQVATLQLTSGGLVITAGGGSPVPLPAAIWLLGSGLLGLVGVGRRKASAAA